MYVLKIASPVIFVVGIAANILCFFIFTSKRMKNLPTFKFLAYLSLIDCLHIATGMPHIMFIIYGNDYDFRTSSDFVCSFHSFLTIYTSHLSSNVLAAIGVFRCTEITSTKLSRQSILNKNAMKSRRKLSNSERNIVYSTNEMTIYQRFIKSFGKVELIMLIIMLIIFAFDSHYLIFMRLAADPDQNITENQPINYICYPTSETNVYYYNFYLIAWPWIDLILYSFLPFLIMTSSTIVIIYKLCNENKNLKKRCKSNEITNKCIDEENTKASKESIRNNLVLKEAKKRSKRNNQVYRLLLSLNILFFIFVTPIVLCNHLKLLDLNHRIILESVYVLAYLNHCINFILYGLSCKLFKNILIEKINSIRNLSINYLK